MGRTDLTVSFSSLISAFCIGFTASVNLGAIATADVASDISSTSGLGTTVAASAIPPSMTMYDIGGGTTQGTNLFHSFDRFSLGTSDTARFLNNASITNIFSRVVGTEASTIDGTIQTNGDANLFLINPNGISFGNSATLAVGGSFVASTAEAITFGDTLPGFSTKNFTDVSLLTVTAPIGLQFGSSTPADINVAGSGNSTLFNSDFTLDLSSRPAGLAVAQGKTLGLVGGNINLMGGNLTAPTGNLEVGAVGANQTVDIDPNTLNFNYGEVSDFGDITLTNAASLDVSGLDAGRIQVQGRNISLQNGSLFNAQVANNTGSMATAMGNGEIFVQASNSLVLDGLSPSGATPSAIYVTIGSNAVGVGEESSLSVKTPLLRLTNAAQIGLGNAGTGLSGSLNVEANVIEADGNIQPSGLFSGLFAAVLPSRRTTGATTAGTLSIRGFNGNEFAERLSLTNGGQILNSSFDFGNAGQLDIKARTVEVVGFGPAGPSSIQSAVEFPLGGLGGSVRLEGDRLLVSGGGQISSSTQSRSQPAGNVEIIMSDTIELAGQVENGRSGIFANAVSAVRFLGLDPVTGAPQFQSSNSAGDGGDISLNTNQLIIRDGATVNVGNFVSNPAAPTETQGFGAAGNINIFARDVLIKNDGRIVSDAAQSNSAGNISIETPSNTSISLEQGLISASGGDGNLFLRSPVIKLDDGSLLTTNGLGTGAGGNILILSEFLLGFNNSDITANAEQAQGGRVVITGFESGLTLADVLKSDVFPDGEPGTSVFGLEVRDRLTPLNDITVTSELGAASNGRVDINTEQGEIKKAEDLNKNPLNDVQLVEAACNVTRGNQLVTPGRGGLPAVPSGLRSPVYAWEDMRLDDQLLSLSPTTPIENIASSSGGAIDGIIQAQGWVENAQGQYTLVEATEQLLVPTLATHYSRKDCTNLRG